MNLFYLCSFRFYNMVILQHGNQYWNICIRGNCRETIWIAWLEIINTSFISRVFLSATKLRLNLIQKYILSDPGWPHVGPMNLTTWVLQLKVCCFLSAESCLDIKIIIPVHTLCDGVTYTNASCHPRYEYFTENNTKAPKTRYVQCIFDNSRWDYCN